MSLTHHQRARRRPRRPPRIDVHPGIPEVQDPAFAARLGVALHTPLVGGRLRPPHGHVAGAWREVNREQAITDRVRAAVNASKLVESRPGLARYVRAAMAEFLTEALRGVTIYRNGDHEIIVDRGVSARKARRVQKHFDRLLRMYPPPAPLTLRIVKDSRVRRVTGLDRRFEPQGFAIVGGRTMTLAESALRGRHPALSHEYAHLMDVYGNSHWDLYKRYRRFLRPYGRINPEEAFAVAFETWDTRRGYTLNPAARAYARRYGWRRGS